MAKLTKSDVKHIAQLARLGLTEKEVRKYQKQLSEIIDYVGQLNRVDTKGVEPISQITGLKQVFRQDKARPSLSQAKALSGAPAQHNNFFKVKSIL